MRPRARRSGSFWVSPPKPPVAHLERARRELTLSVRMQCAALRRWARPPSPRAGERSGGTRPRETGAAVGPEAGSGTFSRQLVEGVVIGLAVGGRLVEAFGQGPCGFEVFAQLFHEA